MLFWANIYLGDINRALKIVSEIELLSDENNQDFLYPTIGYVFAITIILRIF